MRNTKILDLARIDTSDLTISGCEFKVREPSTMEMIRYRELCDEKEGGSKARGWSYLFETCVFNPDMTKAFDSDEAMAIAVGSTRVAMPLINALMKGVGERAEEPKEGEGPKDEVIAETSPSS